MNSPLRFPVANKVYVHQVHVDKSDFSHQEDISGIDIWPASCFLAIIMPTLVVSESSILELGAGVGMAASFALRFLNPSHYYAQQYPNQACSLKKNIEGYSRAAIKIIEGIWGDYDLINDLKCLPPIDYVLLADCFYSKQSFADLVYTLKTIAASHPAAEIICVHHERKYLHHLRDYLIIIFSDNDNLSLYLEAFGLEAQETPLTTRQVNLLEKFIYINKNMDMREFEAAFSSMRIVRFQISSL